MANERGDVMLIQFLLKALLHGDKKLVDTVLTRPSGPALIITGVWDQVSKTYMEHWEQSLAAVDHVYGLRSDLSPPGIIVPYAKGGKKIISLNVFCKHIFGTKAYSRLELPNVFLPREVSNDLFLY